ncbi:sensor histidine kinase [Paratissierella segnis]|uniref:GHKL domain-containing protein n=1 Tax=Paratissierella segnis TaxID=2763679 RepID=A0A926IJ08_9FIRM|nr:sensor histidine kinase [Paratissierella segnis]MBC8586906.1 GHKL domain-containing protein [Paratissierella segnis]
MDLNNYIIYLSSELIYVYTIYKLMHVFFKDIASNNKIEILSYFSYYFIISALYLIVNIPIITLVSNIILLALISFNYEATYKNRFIAVFLIYLILMISETIVSLLTGYLVISVFGKNPGYSFSLGYIFSKLIGFFAALFIENYSNIKKGFELSTSYWLSILIISLSSLYIVVALVDSQIHTVKASIIISLLFLIIVLLFYLYDALKSSAEMKIEKSILEQEKRYYDNQFWLMKSSVEKTASLKHDIANHIGAIGSLIRENEISRALNYINQLEKYAPFNSKIVESGNLVIDSILNYKLDYVKSIGVNTHLDIKVPSDLELESFDMVVILGNLLDNSVEALKKLKENRTIWVSIKYDRGVLIIQIQNNFDGKISVGAKGLITTKDDKDNHGLGLKNIESTLEKYNGLLEYSYTDNLFKAEVLMYL